MINNDKRNKKRIKKDFKKIQYTSRTYKRRSRNIYESNCIFTKSNRRGGKQMIDKKSILHCTYFDENKNYIVEVYKDKTEDMTDDEIKELFNADEVIRV